MRRKRRYRTPEEIRRIVDEFEKSGLTQAAFAKRIDVHLSVLGRWLRHQRSGHTTRRATTALVPVRVKPRVEPAPCGFEVVLENGRLVRVHPGFDEEALGRVVGVLERC